MIVYLFDNGLSVKANGAEMVWLHGTIASLIKMSIVISRTYENNVDSKSNFQSASLSV